MVKRNFKIVGLALVLLFTFPSLSQAQNTGDEEPQSVQDASFKSRCLNAESLGFPQCADSPSECISGGKEVDYNYPLNCLFLQEPIGGRTGYDLFKLTTLKDGNVIYSLWLGETLVGQEEGPVQAILTFEMGKETEGPFGLLYNYLGLVYNYLSGIIVAVVILIVIVAGIRISTAGGNAEGAKAGKDMIIKALVGMILWFTASVVLYTINPTFFAF